MTKTPFILATLLSIACSSSADIVPVPSADNNSITRTESLSAALDGAKADGSKTFRVRFNLPLGDGRVADTEVSVSLKSLLRFPQRGVFLVPGSVGPLEFYDSNVSGFDAGDILAQAGYFAVTSNLPGVGSSSGPTNGADANATYLGDFYLRTLKALKIVLPLIDKWDVYGEEGTGGNTTLLLAQHSEIVRTASGGAQIYHVLTPFGLGALTSPQQIALLDSAPNGYFSPPPQLYALFFSTATTEFQTAACGGVGCPGPSGFLLTDGPYPTGIFFDAVTAFGQGGSGYIVRADGAKVPGFFQQGANDFLAAAPDDVTALVGDYGSTGGGHATSAVCSTGFHFVRTDAGSGNGSTSCFWSNELAFLSTH